MNKKILYFSIPLILLTVGFYYLSHAHSHFVPHSLSSVVLPKDNFAEYKNIIEAKKNIISEKKDTTKDKENIDLKKRKEDVAIKSFFSPKDDIRKILIDHINKETKAIWCAAFRLTDPSITQALIEAYQRKVKLIFVIDKEGFSALYSKFLYLFSIGIPIYIYPPIIIDQMQYNYQEGLMHNKFFVFHEQQIVWTGSFNFTKAAQERNQENIVIIYDPEVTFLLYKDHFNYLIENSSKFVNKDIKLTENKKKTHKKKYKKKEVKKINDQF